MNRAPWLGRCLAWLELASQVRRERRQLGSASDAILKDIGISRADADREALRPYRDLPANRLRRLPRQMKHAIRSVTSKTSD